MLFVEINELEEVKTGPFTRKYLQERLGDNVQLPDDIKDSHINEFGYACVGETLSELVMDKTTYLKPTIVKNTSPDAPTLFTRTWELVPYPSDIPARVERKFAEIRKERDRLLSQTDFAASDDYFYMKDQMVEYRNALRDLTDQNSDPFLITFPEAPQDPKTDMTLEGRKLYAQYKAEERFRRTLYNPGEVDTGLGFFVKGGEQNYLLIKGARDMGINSVYSTDNVKHNLTAVEMDTVVSAIETHTQLAFDQKKTVENEIALADAVAIETIISNLKS